jgi:Uncharacterized protein conserved in bacteria
MFDQELMRASESRCYEVAPADLPLSCPMPQMRLWDAHPKVYLPIEETGKATCPYCGAQYVLVAADNNDSLTGQGVA